MTNNRIDWAEIEALKDRLGLTWQQIADQTLLDVSTLRNWRRGKPRWRAAEITFLRRIEQLKRRKAAQ